MVLMGTETGLDVRGKGSGWLAPRLATGDGRRGKARWLDVYGGPLGYALIVDLLPNGSRVR
jgi:hypothetical protein